MPIVPSSSHTSSAQPRAVPSCSSCDTPVQGTPTLEFRTQPFKPLSSANLKAAEPNGYDIGYRSHPLQAPFIRPQPLQGRPPVEPLFRLAEHVARRDQEDSSQYREEQRQRESVMSSPGGSEASTIHREIDDLRKQLDDVKERKRAMLVSAVTAEKLSLFFRMEQELEKLQRGETGSSQDTYHVVKDQLDMVAELEKTLEEKVAVGGKMRAELAELTEQWAQIQRELPRDTTAARKEWESAKRVEEDASLELERAKLKYSRLAGVVANVLL